MFVDHADAWRPTFAFGAYVRTIEIMHLPMPAIVFGKDAQSVELALATAAGIAVGSLFICIAYPQKSGSMWKSAVLWPIFWRRNRQSEK